MIAVPDIGKHGAWAFERHAGLNRREIDIAGDRRTAPETAGILGRATGTPVKFARLHVEEVRKSSADFAMMLDWFDRLGYNATIESTSRESGIRPTTLAEWAATARWAPAEVAR